MTDLELLTGTLSSDTTVLVAKLIETRGDKKEILKYGSYCSDSELIQEVRRVLKNDTYSKTKVAASEVNTMRCRYERWKGRF